MSSAAYWQDMYQETCDLLDACRHALAEALAANVVLRDERDGLAQTVRGYIVRDSQLDFFKEQLTLNTAANPGATVARALGEQP